MKQEGSWRCPACGAFNLSGDACTWPKRLPNGRSSLYEVCPGRRPGPRLSPRQMGRGIGNKPPRRKP